MPNQKIKDKIKTIKQPMNYGCHTCENGEKQGETETESKTEKWLLLLSPAGLPIKILQKSTADIEK